MPFVIELRTHQKTKLWTFKKTKEALELQDLLDKGDRHGYTKRLLELTKTSDPSNPRRFSRTRGIVYEMFDEDETIELPIKFQVKNSVITWFFIAPMDRTHQAFRDLLFNTAAKAHTSVQNSCETYYRGTDHLHLRVMHIYEGEAEFNHNHYRTASNGPITPVEVYEHLFAFYAQSLGRKFISSAEERDDIILKFAIYWADFNLDINYVALSFMDDEGGVKRVISQLENIARAGTLTPDDADKKLDEFFASGHGKNIFKLAESRGFPSDPKKRETLKNYLKTNYRIKYIQFAPPIELEIALDVELEPFSSSQFTSSASSHSTRSSPRDEYLAEPGQLLDEIDQLEYDTFARDLTKHCHSINKELLEDLTLEDFRKGLLLYHALRTTQETYKYKPIEGQRFHPDLTTHNNIAKMIKELPSLQMGSTEHQLGATLINRLIRWVTTASPKLEEWVKWVSENGSRGLGSEIGQVRSLSGKIDLTRAVPPEDRASGSKIAEIDFDKVDLGKIFLPDSRKDHSIASPKPNRLIQKLSLEMQQLIFNQQGVFKLEKSVFQAKIAVINAAIDVLSDKAGLPALLNTIEENKNWDIVSWPKMNSKLKKYVEQVIELNSSTPTPYKISGIGY